MVGRRKPGLACPPTSYSGCRCWLQNPARSAKSSIKEKTACVRKLMRQAASSFESFDRSPHAPREGFITRSVMPTMKFGRGGGET